MGAGSMLGKMRSLLGLTGRPNKVTRWYASERKHGDMFLNAPWCDMTVTYAAVHSGNADAVLPNGDRAYTVYHAQDFQREKRWYPGTTENVNNAKPGDIVFFDWGGTNVVVKIDHVGVVEKALGGGRVQTIEGNTSNGVHRRVRGAGDIAGIGRPAYTSSKRPPKPPESPSANSWPKGARPLVEGRRGAWVKKAQEMLNLAIDAKLAVDGVFGLATKNAVLEFQRAQKLQPDGRIGPLTWSALAKAARAAKK